MSEARLERRDDGSYLLSGTLSFASVPAVLAQGGMLCGENPGLSIDLSGVEHADSAGIALLLEWLRLARHTGCKVVFRGVPAQLRAIARLSDLDAILPLEEAVDGADPA